MDGSRSRRKISATKESRLALLARVREAKESGTRLFIEKEEAPVYETVEESQYADLVRKRLEDDWIVDDEGDGYAEDGREIFDDNDEDEEMVETRKHSHKSTNQTASKKKRLNPDIRSGATGSLIPSVGRDIRTLFSTSNQSHKKKTVVDTAVDPNLDDLLAELESSVPEPSRQPAAIHSFSEKKRPKISNSQNHRLSHGHVSRKIADSFDLDDQPPRQSKPHHRVQEHRDTPNPFSLNRIKSRFDKKSVPTEIIQSNEDLLVPDEPIEAVVEQEFSNDFDESDNSFVPKPEVTKPVPVTKLEEKIDEREWCEPAVSLQDWLSAAQSECSNTTMLMHDEELFKMSTSKLKNDDRLYFYWFDAYEDARTTPGVVYLFGKVYDETAPNHYASCCLRIKDLERRVFLLPRPKSADGENEVTVKDVYMEFRDLTSKYNIGKFRCKTTTKRYAFEFDDVPDENEYLEVRYPASYPALPSDLNGQTFSRIFGTNTSFLENFVLELKLRGPCWLEVKTAVELQPQISWCRSDYEVIWKSASNCPITKLSTVIEEQRNQPDADAAKCKLTQVPRPPAMCLVSLDVKSVAQSKSNHSEIICIGLLINNKYSLDQPVEENLFQTHYLVLAPPKDAALPYDLRTKLPTFGNQYKPPNPSSPTSLATGIDIEPNERSLLGRFLTRIHKLDPDLVVGHDMWGHHIELILQRMLAQNVPHWHRIGRLRRSAQYSINLNQRSWLIRHSLPGRLVCDTRISSRELVRSRTYNLSDLASQVFESTTKSNPKSVLQRQVPRLILNQIAGKSSSSPLDVVEMTDLEIDSADLRSLFVHSHSVRQLIDFCLSDAHLVLRLTQQLQIVPLAMQITSICGNVLGRTLSGGRAERNEALLLHAFTQNDYIVPDPPQPRRHGAASTDHWDADQEGAGVGDDGANTTGRRKPAYAGGLVLEPKKGFYDRYILLLDFNSLYPSIIQEFNVCFTTVDRSLVSGNSSKPGESGENVDLDVLVTMLFSMLRGDSTSRTTNTTNMRLPISQSPGLLPAEIRRLVESRREVKKLLATSTDTPATSAQRAQWNIRQAALKLTANSVYGCLGFAGSRFCARGMAALVTALGRSVLSNTKELVENMNLEVIYGDTDSIMVNTNTTDLLVALNIGEKIRHEVNKHYRLLELDTDGVYAAMLLLAKKKYAALAIVNPIAWSVGAKQALAQNKSIGAPPSTKQEVKGLDIVRRDWSALAVSVGRRCVEALLSGDAKDKILERIHADLGQTADKIRQGTLPISDYVITKMLTKNPEDYHDSKSQPHVQVALRLNLTAPQDSINDGVKKPSGTVLRKLRAGDTIEYIICDDGSGRLSTQRAYSISEYSSSQIKPNDGQTPSKTPLAIDVNYYLAHQIHPVISRLIAPIEGTSPAQIADCLGLDSSHYRRVMVAVGAGDDDDDNNPDSYSTGGFGKSNSWGDVDYLEVQCPNKCNDAIVIKSSAFNDVSKCWSCSKCSHNLLSSTLSIRSVTNRLVLTSRALIQDYELGWMTCEDPTCGLVTRSLSCPPLHAGAGLHHHDSDGFWARGGRPLCPACGGQAMLKSNFKESKLYRQLCFYRYLVSPVTNATTAGHQDAEALIPAPVNRLLSQCRSHFDNLLGHSAFAMVDLSRLFSGIRTSIPLTAPCAR